MSRRAEVTLTRSAAGMAGILAAASLVALGPCGHPLTADADEPRAGVPVLPVVLPFDFNGDTRPELAVGAPSLAVDSRKGAGGVWVYSASTAGLEPKADVITEATRGVPGTPRAGDAFGTVLASADFDRDGFADLAVGHPGEDVGHATDAGSVTVLYGSATGLDLHRAVALHAPAGVHAEARFGTALAAGDFDGDGYPDLAVGAPGDRVQRNRGHRWAASGSVQILRGGRLGLTSAHAMLRLGRRVTGDDGFDVRFGAVLAAGDLSHDGIADLVVGAPGRAYAGKTGYSGWISTCVGRLGKVAGCHRISLPYAKQYARGWAGMTSMVVGPLRWRAAPELVVGSPHYQDGDPGRIWDLELARDARLVRNLVSFSQGHPRQIPGADLPHRDRNRFGQTVAIGQFQNTLTPLLAVGSPGTDAGRGSVTTISFDERPDGTLPIDSYTQRTSGVPGGSTPGNAFGTSVAFADHDADGIPELAVGVPGLDEGTGGVTVLHYDPTMNSTGGQLLQPEDTPGAPVRGSRFGRTIGGA